MTRLIAMALLAFGALGALGHILGLSALASVPASLTGAVIVAGAVLFASDLIVRKLSQLLVAAGVEDDHVEG